MRQERLGGETVYRVYERERLRRMAQKLGLRLLKFKDGRQMAPKAERGESRGRLCPVVVIDGQERTVSD